MSSNQQPACPNEVSIVCVDELGQGLLLASDNHRILGSQSPQRKTNECAKFLKKWLSDEELILLIGKLGGCECGTVD